MPTWAFPPSLQPDPEEVGFDLVSTLDAIVGLRAEIPGDAFTAPILGTVRSGSGIVLADDLVLTIGYLITEAQTVWLTLANDEVLPAHPVAYDQVTGFGLVRPLGRLGMPRVPRGTAASCRVGHEVYLIGHGGLHHALKAKIVAKREFAGYWEYVLDQALFTAPAHPEWGGAALVGGDGKLLGVGSLLVEETIRGRKVQGNMVVPIDLLGPIYDDLLRTGRANRPPRAWLGMYTTETDGLTVVAGVAEDGPADVAGVRVGDVVVEVAGEPVQGLADLFRKVWRLGPAGTEVPLTLAGPRGKTLVRLRSADRNDFLKKPLLH